ncbi:MAG TPA: hypothetical protein VMB79_10180 [Jatrophihabitans sp.]|nr:hypothetical protein [Jatrophihabitans sp.]
MSDATNRRPNSGETAEVCCKLCNQTFLPADPTVPIHVVRRDGELCGGAGVPFRPYVIRDPNRW